MGVGGGWMGQVQTHCFLHGLKNLQTQGGGEVVFDSMFIWSLISVIFILFKERRLYYVPGEFTFSTDSNNSIKRKSETSSESAEVSLSTIDTFATVHKS